MELKNCDFCGYRCVYKLTHLYLKLSEMVELQDNDYDQALEYLYCCKEMTKKYNKFL